MNINDYDIVSVKEGISQHADDGYCHFFPAFSTPQFPEGSIWLILRRRKTVNVGFGARSFKKEFEEIVLAPDGSIGVLDYVRKKKIA